MSILPLSISTGSVDGSTSGIKDKNTRDNARIALLQGLFDKQKCAKRKEWMDPSMWGARLSAGLICNKQHISDQPNKVVVSSFFENGIQIFKRMRFVRKCSVFMKKFNRKSRKMIGCCADKMMGSCKSMFKGQRQEPR